VLQFTQGLYVEQCPEGKQRLDRDFGSIRFPEAVADRWVEHPTRYGQPRLVVEFYDERFIVLSPQAPNDVDGLAVVGMMSVVNSMGVRFMSSVMMPVGMPTRPINWSRGCR
jgi:hypothetical protein